MFQINSEPGWMDEIGLYLKEGKLPEDKKQAQKVRVKSARF